jgi:hypothetical protein
MRLSQQEMTMFKQAVDFTASAALTEDELELVSGGVDAMGNMPICPPPRPVIHFGGGGPTEPGGPCGPLPY